MSLGIHPDARSALIAALSKELVSLQVQNNSFLLHDSTGGLARLDFVLPGANSRLGQRIAAIFGDEPFSDFVYDQLSILLQDRPFLSDCPDVGLTTLDGFENAERIAEDLVTQFDSLPWSYSLFASLPYEIGRRLSREIPSNDFPLNDQYRLIRFGDSSDEYPAWSKPNSSLLLGASEERFNPELLYLNGQVSGYVGRYLGLRPINDFGLALRALLGIGIAERVFKPRYYHFFGDRKSSVVIFRREGEKWLSATPQELESRTSNLLHSIGPNRLIAKEEDPSTGYLSRDFLSRARATFEDGLAKDRLLGSAQWLFDSYADTSTLLAFVQAMVALEILLGDKGTSDAVGVGELLANRCAYLIATNLAQREEILGDFKRIYDTRSRIVHRGHNKLSRREESDLGRLRWMVSRALQEEIKLSMSK